MMGTVELDGDDIIHISDNNASATFFGTTSEAMRGRSARELGVPEAYIRIWLEAYRRSVTSDGPVRFDYQHEGKGWLSVSVNYIGRDGERERFLYVVSDVSDRVRGEAELRTARGHLEDRVAFQAKQVRSLAASLTLAEQRERNRISQLLHDELQQQLFALQLTLRGMARRIAPELADDLNAAIELTRTSTETTRTLISELSPSALQGGDLAAALEWLAGHMKDRYNLIVSVQAIEDTPRIPNPLAVLLFQCIQELLFNVVKHASTVQATVIVRPLPEGVQVEVADEGVGFNPDTKKAAPTHDEAFGLQSVEHRLAAFGGVVSVSSAPGEGTRVAIGVPLD